MASIVGAPLVTPVALQNALLQSRRVGNPNDPYGTIAAMRSVGDSYINSQNQLQHLDRTTRDQAETDARLAAGYYPAQAQATTAEALTRTGVAQDKLTHLQDIQRAVKETLAEMPRNDPRFIPTMQAKLTNYGAIQQLEPQKQLAIKQLQIQQQQQSRLENEIPKLFAFKMAKENYPAMAAERARQLGVPKLVEGSKEYNELWNDLINSANQHVASMGLQVQLNPADGTVKVTDNQGIEKIIPEEALADFYQIARDPAGLYKIHTDIFNRGRLTDATKTSSALAGGKLGLEAAQAQKALGSTAGRFGKTNNLSDEEIKHLAFLEKTKYDLIKKWADQPEILKQHLEPLNKEIAEMKAAVATRTSSSGDIGPQWVDPTIAAGRATLNPGPANDYGSTAGRVPGVDYASPPYVDPYGNVDMSGLQVPVPAAASSDYNPQRAAQTMDAFRLWKAFNMPPEAAQPEGAPFFAGSR